MGAFEEVMLKLTITQSELSFFKLIAILKGLLKDYKSLDIEIRYEEKEENHSSDGRESR